MHRTDALAYANACHAAEVEVDPETGEIKVLRYIALQDSGILINPMMVDGQVQGGVAHGIGNAFYEWMGYDDAGQPVTTTFADYLLPTAAEVPMMQTLYKETPSPLNPLGVKGVGEAGTIPAAAALICCTLATSSSWSFASFTSRPRVPSARFILSVICWRLVSVLPTFSRLSATRVSRCCTRPGLLPSPVRALPSEPSASSSFWPT
mgnify:CR=1 FL=1